MTDDTTDDATDEQLAEAGGEEPDDAEAGDGTAGTDDGEPPTDGDGGTQASADAVREYLLKAALVLLVVLGVVATLQFYLHAQAAIGQLVAREYQRLFLATFNLAVLLGVGIGIAQVVRRLG